MVHEYRRARCAGGHTPPEARKRAQQVIFKARQRTHLQVLDKLTDLVDDQKGGIEFDPAKVRLATFPAYCMLCGWALALAHAKSGDAALLAG